MTGTKHVILGIGHGAKHSHDAGAALLIDGQLIAACDEERFTRRKHDTAFPHNAIRFCLDHAELTARDVTCVAVAANPWAAMRPRWRHLGHCSSPHRFLQTANWLVAITGSALRSKRMASRMFPNAKTHAIEHHLAHAASAFFCSPFERAAIWSVDGRGEFATSLMAIGDGLHIRKLAETYYPQSLGIFYCATTEYLGFQFMDESKVMGLSSYGQPRYHEIFARAMQYDSGLLIRIAPGWVCTHADRPVVRGCRFGPKFLEHFGPPREPTQPLNDRHADIAASVQRTLESVARRAASDLVGRAGCRKLVMAGGVCLNGLMNQAVIESLGISDDDVFIQPAASDSGLSLGAALYAWHSVSSRPRQFAMQHAFWGPGFTNDEIRDTLDRELVQFKLSRYTIARHDSPAEEAARLLADNQIVGWFQGRMEYGPRALGHRSILADPRDAGNKERINACVKFREPFRPFAPSVLEDRAEDYFEGLSRSPFMSRICRVRQDQQQAVPAITHVDGTARPHTVTKQSDPLFYQLIHEFCRRTGIPMVLNTSFNVKGEPIVNTPFDAIRCFKCARLDALVIGNYVVVREEA